jgi:hypothetical protein
MPFLVTKKNCKNIAILKYIPFVETMKKEQQNTFFR